MLTGKLKNQVDEIWEVFWTGGVTNPISVIEQFTYLLFIRRLDEIHTSRERQAMLLETDIAQPIFATEQANYRWNKFKNLDPQVMFDLVKDKVFPFIKTINGEDTTFAKHMSDAIFMIPKAQVLDKVVNLIDKIPMDDRDTKGDLYEYMLSKLQSSGTNGQFRTPRHIIQMMVEMTQPKLDGNKSDVICDPASGTCGFLMASEEYVRKQFENELMKPENSEHFHNKMFNAYDFDQHMLRIGAMNLMLHGVEHPTVEYKDSLSDYGEQNISDKYTLILANPPFKGSVAYDELSPDLLTALGKTPKKAAPKVETDEDGNKKAKKGPSEKTELLFLALILRMLQPGGRAAVIVPDGVLFGSTKSHIEIRKAIIEDHKLDAVVSLPSGVFKPYAGVSTAILFFTKTNSGGTDNVWFYDMQADGFSLDDKRTPLIKDLELTTEADVIDTSLLESDKAPSEHANHKLNNIPDVLYRWQQRKDESSRKRTEQSFYVPVAEITSNDYDLSINRYKEVVYKEVQYDEPQVILNRIKELQQAMDKGIADLEAML
ncbi:MULTISPECIES: type I restriction-modification system subunit M [Pseudoalteromonas]|uniref:site-specific DNA-methyltransferase (adenine-specific) n=1 Tax=Pseudoalteromonas arctica TaxID=394751 RepID=A0A7Y0DVH0_9GAMM|nr:MULTISPECIES: class I SAM-dependent DNA methyltransferase [Pseudoalteromonas]MBE3671825.1 type I restriction enzyme M protein [Pseudoalteromonas distincta KMM 3548]NMM42364.1 SAM-dependent DNA methyltransferase [Pseudoalteromonas arctica]